MTDQMVAEYLYLLECSDCRALCRENLERLQRAHLEKIPYNNLGIYVSGTVPSLDEQELFNKIIRQKRGGYCFELNGLFTQLLRSLGYEVEEYFARWHFGGSDAVPMRRHRICKVVCDDREFISDVSIGSAGSVIPFDFTFDTEQERAVRNYRFMHHKMLGILLETKTSDGWVPYYSFTQDPHYPQDFEYANYFCAANPDSVFRKKFFMHRQTENVQYYIEDLQQSGVPFNFCIRKSKDEIEKTVVESSSHLQELLEQYFDIFCSISELPEKVR